jgi:hypothetical protein
MNCDVSHELPSAFDDCNSIHGAEREFMAQANSLKSCFNGEVKSFYVRTFRKQQKRKKMRHCGDI